jgi:hypothetical protein
MAEWYEGDDTAYDAPPPVVERFERQARLDEGWSWQDTRLVSVDRGVEAGQARYEIGVMDVYADAHSGDMGGSYLPLQAFDQAESAQTFYETMQADIDQQGLTVWELADFSTEKVADPDQWRSATTIEYLAYETHDLRSWNPELSDTPPPQALENLYQTALTLGGFPEVEAGAFQALANIGVQAEDFNPQHNPPPFLDAETGTAYWIGVFQADPQDPSQCVTSILSLGHHPDSGQLEAQLAPCVPGDWDKAHQAAEYLIAVAEKGGLEALFETAQGMAIATDQHDFWQAERGLVLESTTTAEIAKYTREHWEVSL